MQNEMTTLRLLACYQPVRPSDRSFLASYDFVAVMLPNLKNSTVTSVSTLLSKTNRDDGYKLKRKSLSCNQAQLSSNQTHLQLCEAVLT